MPETHKAHVLDRVYVYRAGLRATSPQALGIRGVYANKDQALEKLYEDTGLGLDDNNSVLHGGSNFIFSGVTQSHTVCVQEWQIK